MGNSFPSHFSNIKTSTNFFLLFFLIISVTDSPTVPLNAPYVADRLHEAESLLSLHAAVLKVSLLLPRLVVVVV